LAKDKAKGRIDGMVALAMAMCKRSEHIETEGDIDDFLSAPLRV